MDTRVAKSRSRPGKGSLAGSAAVHLVAVVVAFLSQAGFHSRPEFVTYRIELVSPPPTVVGEPEPEPVQEELVVETPEPEPEPEPEETPPPPEPEPSPREEETPPPDTDVRQPEPEPAERETPPRSPDAEPSRERSGEGINVRLEGLRRDYPAYYENIIRQIQRCFRWRGSGNPTATVQFTVDREGGVSELRFVRRSGDPAFDFEAMGAVECAGTGARFGPLPEEFPYDLLPIEFTFEPRGRP